MVKFDHKVWFQDIAKINGLENKTFKLGFSIPKP